MNVLHQYLQVINSVFLCIVLLFIRFLSIYIFGRDNYQHITQISQNISIPVPTIYILGTNPFVLDDLKIICSLFLTQFIGAVIIIPFLFIFKVQQKLKTFAVALSVIQINNCITGIPFYSGIYSSILPKYGYMQILGKLWDLLTRYQYLLRIFRIAEQTSQDNLLANTKNGETSVNNCYSSRNKIQSSILWLQLAKKKNQQFLWSFPSIRTNINWNASPPKIC
ncbi:Membrane_transport family protein [Hexamita inflata]|uniref:Membrane_transport family protein n=1 Tax=Hexamita inflata TaxID=28002 RepID=A0ABP1HRR8_9EUKA